MHVKMRSFNPKSKNPGYVIGVARLPEPPTKRQSRKRVPANFAFVKTNHTLVLRCHTVSGSLLTGECLCHSDTQIRPLSLLVRALCDSHLRTRFLNRLRSSH